jgi:hypothetical protein
MTWGLVIGGVLLLLVLLVVLLLCRDGRDLTLDVHAEISAEPDDEDKPFN